MVYYFRRNVLLSRLVTRQDLFLQPQKFALRNPKLTLLQSSFPRSYTDTSPPNLPSKESTSSSNAFIFAGIVLGILGVISSDLLYAWQRDAYNQRLLNNTVEKGTRPKVTISEDKLVPRTATIERLKEILHYQGSRYHVICGEPGTGKSTLIQIASREVGQDKDKGIEGGMGVIYVEMPPDSRSIVDFGEAFGKALNFKFEENISFTKKILGLTNNEYKRPKWKRALEAFRRASKVYKAKHNRLPVIVYDDISKLASENPRILDVLQDDAKMSVDKQEYIVVFVGEGSLPRRMQSRSSSWSRAYKPVMEIGDTSEKEAKEYLVKKCTIEKKVDNEVKKECVIKDEQVNELYEMVGGRILELRTVAEKFLAGKSLEFIKESLLQVAENKFDAAQLLPNQLYHKEGKKAIRALLNSKELPYLAFMELFNNDTTVEKLLQANVFTYHPERNTVSFQSKSIEYFVREKADMFIK